MSEHVFNERYPTGKIPRKSKDFGRTFICRRGCDTQSATYTEEFIWEDLQRRTAGDIEELVNWLDSVTQSTKKRKTRKRTKADDDFTGGPINDEELELETPRKKQKHSAVSTPRKVQTPSKLLTPSHKRYFPGRPNKCYNFNTILGSSLRNLWSLHRWELGFWTMIMSIHHRSKLHDQGCTFHPSL